MRVFCVGMKDVLMDRVVQTFEPTGMPVSLKVSTHSLLCIKTGAN